MKKTYPDTKVVEGQHPFMLSFCHGKNIHDVMTKIDVPQQEELMFVFPVMYNTDSESKLCSYIPVLYLDSALGVAGGLYYGLRKEYHPEMKHNETDHSKSWHIDKIIDSSFVQTSDKLGALPQFIDQSFKNPFVTISYPPFPHAMFYQAKVHENSVVKS